MFALFLIELSHPRHEDAGLEPMKSSPSTFGHVAFWPEQISSTALDDVKYVQSVALLATGATQRLAEVHSKLYVKLGLSETNVNSPNPALGLHVRVTEA